MTAVQGNQKADREEKRAVLTEGQTLASLTAALYAYPLPEWDPLYISQELVWFETEGGNLLFYKMNGGSLLMAALPYLSHWLPHLSSSSMNELIQDRLISRPS
jgi:hypothetical protein